MNSWKPATLNNVCATTCRNRTVGDQAQYTFATMRRTLGCTKAALDRALTVLCSSDRARIVIGSDKAAWVVLNATYFPVRIP